jgi:uncharacterized repeat protein (TIGR01451 family)
MGRGPHRFWGVRKRRARRQVPSLATFGKRRLRVELLENRRLLNGRVSFYHILAQPSAEGGAEAAASAASAADVAPLSWPSPIGYTPTQICTAYGVTSIAVSGIVGSGAGQTIAIVDAYDDPALASTGNANFAGSDLHLFDLQFGLPDPPSFLKLDQNGGTNYPAASGTTGWSLEESLDVEWAHAIAPLANIVLVEANSAEDTDMWAAVDTARNLPGVAVVSMSFGESEYSGENAEDSHFTTPAGHAGVTFVAATGDSGAPGGYPAMSPNVVAAGGTTLMLNNTTYLGETAWSLGGGGPSACEAQPGYQHAVQSSGARETPDVAFDADPNSGVAVYDSYDFGSAAPWVQVGGTSLSAPCWAGLLAITDQLRASLGASPLDGPSQLLPQLYAMPADNYHDITSGSNGYSAGVGYDMATGIGSPVANHLVASLMAPDLTLGMTQAGSFKQGDAADTYTLTVSNVGVQATSGTVNLADALPAGLTATAMSGQGWTVNLATLTATRSDPLAAGASYPPLTLTVSVAATAPTSVTNQATISGGGDVDTANNTASDTTPIAQAIDLTVGMTHAGTFKQGDAADSYAITVTNLGFAATSGTVSVTDVLPAGLTATAMSGQGWTANLATLTATRSDPLAAGASYPALALTVGVAANAPTSVVNQAAVSGGGEQNTANDTASDTTPIAQQIDLTLTKTHAGTFKQGDVGDAYTITVTNLGFDPSVGAVSVTDALPAGLTATAMSGTGWTVNLATLTATRSDALAGGASYPPLTVTVNVAANAPASVVNRATVSGGGEQNTANDTAADQTSIFQYPDLTVSKTHFGAFTQNDLGDTYEIVVRNIGPGATSGTVSVTDLLPAGLTATGISGQGWDANLALLTAARDDPLGPGAAYPPLTVTVNVAANAPASVTNTATVSGGGEVNTANDTASDMTTILPSVAGKITTVPALGGGVLTAGLAALTVDFHEAVLGAGVAANYELCAAGPDGLLGTADDMIIPLSVTYAGTRAALGFPSLPVGVYRLIVRDAITDTSGHPIEGNGDGQAANWERDFVLTPPDSGVFAGNPLLSSGALQTPVCVTTGDFNGDGIPDLVVASSSSLTLMLGNGSGGFRCGGTFSSGGTDIAAVAAGDFNHDGRLDLAVANEGSDTVGVLLNTGAGFTQAMTWPTGGREPDALALGDFNGDGNLDIAVGNYNDNSTDGGASFAVLLGNGSGGFTPGYNSWVADPLYQLPPVTSLAAADFNGDGYLDLVMGNPYDSLVTLYLGTGAGGFAPPVTYNCGGNDPDSLAVADFNGDGRPDLVTANAGYPYSVGVLLNNGAGGFAAPVTYSSCSYGVPMCVVTGDFNGDGKPDIAVANFTGKTVGVLLNTGGGNFAPVTTYTSSDGFTNFLAAGDFNRDGRLDLVVTNTNSNYPLGVLLGTAGGGFAPVASFPAPLMTWPCALATGDFNGDGLPDIAVADGSTNNVLVYLSSGAGNYSPPVAYSCGLSYLTAIAVGDFNGDGKPDIAVSNGASIAILLNNGADGFTLAGTYSPGGPDPQSLAVGDFNGDGKLDLAVANGNGVTIFPGKGDGTFGPAATYNSGGAGSNSIVAGDFNGDGRLDLAVANFNNNNVDVLLNNGSGGFLPAVTYACGSEPNGIVAGDFNGDGKLDLAVMNFGSDSATVLLGNGAGGFTPCSSPYTSPYRITAIAAADFNGDGRTDLAVVDIAGEISILLSDKSGGLTADTSWYPDSGPYSTLALAAADFNGDGKADLLAANNDSGNLTLYLGNGKGGLMSSGVLATTTVTEGVYGMTTADFNGDGLPDVAVANGTNVSVLLNNGQDGFAPVATYASGGAWPYAIAAGDFNGDGRPDLVVGNVNSDDFSVLLNNGQGGFSLAGTYPFPGPGPTCIAVGDFNGDGKLDLAVGSDAAGAPAAVEIYLGNGEGGFAAPIGFDCGGQPNCIVVADFNGDGNLDIATTTLTTGQVAVLLGDGKGGFAPVVTYPTGDPDSKSLVTGDFNGDGIPDIATANYATDTVGVLLGDGTGGFAPVVTYPTGGQDTRALAVGDFNSDGRTDIAVNDKGTDVRVLLNAGGGRFAAATTYDSGGVDIPEFLAAADFNGDGRTDLLLASANNGSVANLSGGTVGVLLDLPTPQCAVATLTAPSGRTFSVQTGGYGAGQLIGESGGALQGVNRLQVGGQDYTPPLEVNLPADGGQSLVTPCANIAGLYVSRKITVPDAGSQDFARTVDSFANPTSSPITTSVTLEGDLGADAGTATVFATSDGTGVAGPNDQWIGIDGGVDGASPAVIQYIHGPSGLKPSSVEVVRGNVAWTYNLTVPAGQTVELGCLTIVADTRAQAISEAGTLVTQTGFGGHAGDFLSAGSLAALANFQFLIAPTVSVTRASGTYNGAPFAVTGATVTGTPADGVIARFGDPTLSYTYFSGGSALSGPPTDAGSYTVVAHYTSNNAKYASADSAPLAFTIGSLPLAINSVQSLNSLEAPDIAATVGAGGQLTVNSPPVLAAGGGISVVQGGMLSVPGIDAGPGATGLDLDQGTLLASGSFSTATPIALGAGGGQIDSNGNSLTLGGPITGTGGMTLTGAGTTTLAAANSYAGGTWVESGTLVTENCSAIPNGSLLSIGPSGSLVLGEPGCTELGLVAGGATMASDASEPAPIAGAAATAPGAGFATETSAASSAGSVSVTLAASVPPLPALAASTEHDPSVAPGAPLCVAGRLTAGSRSLAAVARAGNQSESLLPDTAGVPAPPPGGPAAACDSLPPLATGSASSAHDTVLRSDSWTHSAKQANGPYEPAGLRSKALLASRPQVVTDALDRVLADYGP